MLQLLLDVVPYTLYSSAALDPTRGLPSSISDPSFDHHHQFFFQILHWDRPYGNGAQRSLVFQSCLYSHPCHRISRLLRYRVRHGTETGNPHKLHTHRNRFMALLEFVRDCPGEPAQKGKTRKVKLICFYWNNLGSYNSDNDLNFHCSWAKLTQRISTNIISRVAIGLLQ